MFYEFLIDFILFFSDKDKVEMGLFIARYITTLLIFVIGLKAPGISNRRHDSDSEPLTNNQEVRNEIKSENPSFFLYFKIITGKSLNFPK